MHLRAIRALLCSAILHYCLKRSKTRSNEVFDKNNTFPYVEVV